jgi:hypothetical protein
MTDIYYPVAGDTLPIFFSTYDGGTGASITMTGLAVTDIEIYKDGSVTQRSSDAGYTLLDTDGIDFDGITGIHGFSIDLSDNTDAGFYEVGPWYHVAVSAITVDGQTVNFIPAAFRIVSATRGLAGTALPDAAADAAGGLVISDAGGVDADAQAASVTAIEVDTGTTLDGKLDTIDGVVDDILLDTAEIGAAGAGLTEAGGTGDQLTAVPWNAAWDAEVESEVDDALGTGGADLTAIPWNASWDTEVQSEVEDALDEALADSVPADGSIPSLRQAIYMAIQYLTERAISGTDVSVKKVDGSTELFGLALDDGDNPTSVTRDA